MHMNNATKETLPKMIKNIETESKASLKSPFSAKYKNGRTIPVPTGII